MDTNYIIFCVLAFISVVFLLEAIYFWYQNNYGVHSRRVKKRLLKITNGEAYDRNAYQTIIKQRYQDLPSWLHNLLETSAVIQKIDEWTYQSGTHLNLSKFLRYSLIFAIGGLLVAMLMGATFVISVLIFVIGMFLPTLYIVKKRSERLSKIELQLPEAIDAMTRSLRAGQTVQTAFQLVAEELPDPIASEFRIFIEEVNLGAAFNDALQNLAKRIPLTDVKYLVIAMLVQRDTGGNLFEILSSINRIIRERFKLQGEIKVLSAEGRSSAVILCSLPVVMFFVTRFINAQQMDAFIASDFGRHGIVYGLVMMCIGVFAMMHITRIEY